MRRLAGTWAAVSRQTRRARTPSRGSRPDTSAASTGRTRMSSGCRWRLSTTCSGRSRLLPNQPPALYKDGRWWVVDGAIQKGSVGGRPMHIVSGAVLDRWNALTDEQIVAQVLQGQTALFE